MFISHINTYILNHPTETDRGIRMVLGDPTPTGNSGKVVAGAQGHDTPPERSGLGRVRLRVNLQN